MRFTIPALALVVMATPAFAQGSSGAWQTSRSDRDCTPTADLTDGAHIEFSRSSTSTDTLLRLFPAPQPDQDAADPFKAYGNPLWIANRPAFRTVNQRRGGAVTFLPPADLSQILGAGNVKIVGPNFGSVIALPSTDQLEQDLQTCLTDLRRAERGSGEPQVVAPKLKTDLSGALDVVRHGSEHFRARRMRARLTVAAQGHVLTCTVIESSGTAEVDRQSCRVLRTRARFTPAMDSSGRPTLGTYDAKLVWKDVP